MTIRFGVSELESIANRRALTSPEATSEFGQIRRRLPNSRYAIV